jgi:predicted metal-dependent phosphoesterase TrpH
MLIDLHVHSRATPGCGLEPAQVVARAAALGLDGVAFTDANTFAGLADALAARTEKVAVFVGMELDTDHGHYLAFFPDPEAIADVARHFGTPGAKGFGAREALARVQELGGVAIAAHPYDRDIDRPSGDFIFALKDKLAAVEGLNATKKPGVNDLAVEASEHMRLPCVGGSNATTSVDQVGRASTFFAEPISTHAELVQAIRAGGYFPVGAGRPPALTDLARAHKHSERNERPERFDRVDAGGRDRGGGGGRGGRRGGRDRGGRGRR